MADHILWVASGGGGVIAEPQEKVGGRAAGGTEATGGEAGTPGSEGLCKLQGRQSPA